MRTAAGSSLLLMIVSTIIGCGTIGKIKVDNPVMGPPPPRLSHNDEETPSSASTVTAFSEENSKLQLVNLGGEKLDRVTENSQVVATVNGKPIFAGDLLEPYQQGLDRLEQGVQEGKVPPEFLEKQKLDLIKNGIDAAIERELLVQALMKTLKSEQREMIDGFLDQAFEAEVKRLQEKENIETKHELDEFLKSKSFSLASYRKGFESQTLAQEYLRAKRGNNDKLTREDLMKYYRDHIEDYKNPERVKWQFMVIEFKKHGGKQGAYAELSRAVKELKQGKDFTEIVKAYSDSATRYNGGIWGDGDWTVPGSLSDEKLEKALFTLPVGQISTPFESETEFKLVKVIEREHESVTSFDDLQLEIEKAILTGKQQDATKKVMAGTL
ncbi:MAG: peptidylprolyl isomerase [Planctomycetaceae bacterium]